MSRTLQLTALTAALVLIVIGFLLTNIPVQPSKTESSIHTITIEGTAIHVEIADTDALRSRGLSGHAPLTEDEGMLFVFPEDGFYSFWMHEMTFPIDILWLDTEGKVVHIERNAAPESYPTTFTSGSPARYVLEVRAGFATEHEIGVGSKFADFPL